MKLLLRILAIPVAIVTLFACTDKANPTPAMLENIEINEPAIFLYKGGIQTFTFKVTPANATFNYDVESDECGVSIAISSASSNATPLYYKLIGIEPVDKGAGTYKASIQDKSNSEDYNDKVVIKIETTDAEGKTKTITSNTINVGYAGTKLMSMSLLKENNQTAVYKDLTLDVDASTNKISISSPFISNPNLVMTFESNGMKVLVNGVEQVSGETVNDFSEPVTYTVVASEDKTQDYIVSVTYSGLPVLFINTPNNATIPDKHSDWLANTEIKLYKADWTIDLEGTTGIRGRGNSTWGYPKKPYALKLDSKSSVLGMPKHKRWVLLANWMDRTIMRNRISFAIAMKTGLAWTPRGEFVELILNGQHKGNYYLCEHIKVDENRVNVDELEDDKTDSGYIMELDSYFDEVNKFRSQYYNLPYMFKDPDEVNSAQFTFLQNYVNTLEYALYNSTKFASREYTQYMDVDSFIDWWLVHELTGNEEPKHPKSSYMHKDAGGKLTMGPVWDFDWGTFMPHTKFVCYGRTDGLKPIYYDRLMQDAQFKARVKERWIALETGFREIPAYIESEAARIKGSESMNHKMWPCNTLEVIGYIVNQDEHMTFDQAVARMKSAYEGKLNWMDSQISSW